MIDHLTLRLATRADSAQIAAMSRDLIERGLGWSWTPRRVLRSIGDAHTNVVVALENRSSGEQRLAGFGIMKYHDDEAHLLLLAVQAGDRRRGIGAALVTWLEKAALVSGVGQVYLESRQSNLQARAFYRSLGYREVQTVPGYYQGVEPGVRMAKDLWLDRGITEDFT
jgi:ribosomal-protein-alanine N-acetyltransferase